MSLRIGGGSGRRGARVDGVMEKTDLLILVLRQHAVAHLTMSFHSLSDYVWLIRCQNTPRKVRGPRWCRAPSIVDSRWEDRLPRARSSRSGADDSASIDDGVSTCSNLSDVTSMCDDGESKRKSISNESGRCSFSSWILHSQRLRGLVGSAR